MGRLQADLDNHANQMNPSNDAYWESREHDDRPEDWEEQAAAEDEHEPTQAELDNHANQLNPNSDAYSSSRGE